MIQYYKENRQFYLILFLWLIIGIYIAPAMYVVIPATVLLLYKKGFLEELLMGYFFILLLSDSLNESLFFAKNVKNIYIGTLAVVFFFDLDNFQPLNKLYKIFLPFFAFSFFTMMFSVNDSFFFTSVQKTISYAISFMILPNFVLKLYREHGEEFFKRMVFFLVTSLLVGFILVFVYHDLVFLETGRYRGLLGGPNGLGVYSLLVFIVFFVLNNFFPNLFTRREQIVIYLAVLLSMILTGSRNAVIALFIFFLFNRFYRLSPFLGLVGFLVLLFVIEIIANNIATVVSTVGLAEFFRVNTLQDGSGRYIAWAFAWEQIQNNFFIGKGFAYNEYYMRQYYGMLSMLGHQGGIHNSFLTFWMDQGLIGFVIYLRSYILTFIRASYKTRYAFPIMFSITFTAIFESWLVGSLSVFAFLSLLIFTIITEEEIGPQNQDELTISSNNKSA